LQRSPRPPNWILGNTTSNRRKGREKGKDRRRGGRDIRRKKRTGGTKEGREEKGWETRLFTIEISGYATVTIELTSLLYHQNK